MCWLHEEGAAQMNQQVSFADVLALNVRTPRSVQQHVHQYGPGKQQFGQLWLPDAAGPQPLVIFIHGGCWLNQYDIAHAAPLASAVMDRGYAVWSIEYRRVGDPGGGWPGTFLDVGAAIDHVRVLAAEFPVDHSRVILAGHSAGGHLALWGAARAGLGPANPLYAEAPLAVQGVLGLAAIADLELYAGGPSSCERATLELMGGGPEQQAERYAAASPSRLLPWAAPTRLIQGRADSIVPGAQVDALVAAAGAVGQEIAVSTVDGAGHFDLIHPDTPAFQRFLADLNEMMPGGER